MSENETSNGASGRGLVQFDYLKSGQFRVIHVDGAIGGLTPGGLIHMALYSERPAIPQMLKHEMLEGGTLGPPVESAGRTAFVREMDVDAVMTPAVAQSLITWLQERLGDLRTATNLEKDA